MKNNIQNIISPEWRKFINGHWQKDIPKKAGIYPICDRMGNDAGFMTIYIYNNTPTPVKQWEGWFWSDRYPSLPKPVHQWDDI